MVLTCAVAFGGARNFPFTPLLRRPGGGGLFSSPIVRGLAGSRPRPPIPTVDPWGAIASRCGYMGGAGMLSELKTRLADLERAARAAEGRDEDLAGMVAGLNRAFGALCRVVEEDRPGTAARLLAALEEAADDPEESYSERVTEKMRSMLGCIQEFLLDIGNFTSPRIARAKW